MAPLDSSSKSRILVTGADGFVGHHIIKQILDNTPHQVEATVQTSEDSFRLQSVHLQHPRLTMHVVPDVAKPRSFVQAAQHCHAIIHLASPPLAQSRDNEESILIPALQSVQAIAHAANSNNSVRRLVYCSSFAAMFDPSPQGSSPSKTYTEKDWNPTTYDQAENAPGIMLAYQASKALAEKELERLCSEQDRWDLVSICPGVVFGAPVEGSVDSVAELARSNPIIWSLFNKEKLPPTSVPGEQSSLSSSLPI